MHLAQKSRRYYVPGEKNPSNTLTIPITRVGGNERNHTKRDRKRETERERDVPIISTDKYEINVLLVSFFALKKRGDERRENRGISGEET